MTIDWEAVREEVTGHLQALIRIVTVNPPGNETEAADYLARVVSEAGIAYEVVGGQPGRDNFVARLPGTGRGGRPILLLAHTDVVSVERDQWARDPFGGELVDGYVWGRGAVDTKNQVAANLMVLLLLKREGITLDRDVIMAAPADEEAGSVWGAQWLWENRRDLIDAEYGLNEGGGQLLTTGDRRFYLVQTGEKGSARMRLTARAAPGHASVPRDDTAMYRLGKALVRLHEHAFPTIITPTVAQMLRELAPVWGGEWVAKVEQILAEPRWSELAALPLGEGELLSLRATTQNTVVPTIVRGGHRINVIPSEVSVDIDGRILPGQDAADWVRQVQEVVGAEVMVELLGAGASGIAADPASPFYDTIAATVAELDPGAGVLPFLVSGGTDARKLPGIKIYGFMPSQGENPMALAHNHNERTSVDDLLFATRTLYTIVRRFCGTA